MDKSSRNGATGNSKSSGADLGPPVLAHYQAQWEFIHKETVRQLKEAREQEARDAELKAKQPPQQQRK
ncbi:uncharacterized protein BJX67DRAFT_384984 [Aspergillus lucknowensis]|uniref:Uncharacterized protein n=1 Tax=Aspergillus lucknowensis TaxID=176173 RepID=A0ABR4LIB3_9EURO